MVPHMPAYSYEEVFVHVMLPQTEGLSLTHKSVT